VRSLRWQVSGQENGTQEADRMPRDGAIIFGDLIGKLDVLRVACTKCERAGRYRLDRLELFNARGTRIKKSI
jgi:hypothetical protein